MILQNEDNGGIVAKWCRYTACTMAIPPLVQLPYRHHIHKPCQILKMVDRFGSNYPKVPAEVYVIESK